jgi:hypothetical protein
MYQKSIETGKGEIRIYGEKCVSNEVDHGQIGNCVHLPVAWQVTFREPENGLRLKSGAHWS